MLWCRKRGKSKGGPHKDFPAYITVAQAKPNRGTSLEASPEAKGSAPPTPLRSFKCCCETIGLTFLTQHAVAEDKLLQQRFVKQQLPKGPAGIHRQALGSQVQLAPRKLVQLLQDSLLGLSPALLAQAAVRTPELLHVPEG